MPTIYEQLKAAGVETDHHESDLYAKRTDASAAIVAARRKEGRSVETFTSAIDGTPWYCFPFAFDPFWERRQSRGSAD